MEAHAPSVVAVVTTRDAGPHLDETLRSLVAQDYDQLSILVLSSGVGPDLAPRVAAVAATAFVAEVDGASGYGSLMNHALEMVDGNAFFLLCHDDCTLGPGALRALVEESFRSNAGLVTPKVVAQEDPEVLVHVGQSADKFGAVVERIQPGEVDHGQHDAVREVFVAPGGVTLIRADLFRELGGFDPAISAMGEDLELSWRAQVAGARIVLAPEAVVAHGRRRSSGRGDEDLQQLQALERRHQVRAMFTNSSTPTLWWILPLALVLSAAELVVALLGRDGARVAAIRGAWRYSPAERRALRARRAETAGLRRTKDRALHRRMTRGSARLRTFCSRLFYQGLAVARGVAAAEVVDEVDLDLTGTVGSAFSENQDFDDLDDLGHRLGARGHRRRFLASRSGRLVAWTTLLALFLVGSRNLVLARLPVVGQLTPWPSFGGSWHNLFTGWNPMGLGSTSPAPTGFASFALAGVFTFGHMGLAQNLVVLTAVPLGVVGVARLCTPLVSARARLAGAAAYLALPLWAASMALGRLDGLLAIAALPWLVLLLCRAAGLQPWSSPAQEAPFGAVGWVHTTWGRRTLVAVLLAITAAVAPALVVALLVVAVGFAAGGWLLRAGGGIELLRTTVVAVVGAVVLCLPWLVGLSTDPRALLETFGLPLSRAGAPSLAKVATLAVGPAHPALLNAVLVLAAIVPLVLVRGPRLVVAARLWMVVLLADAVALLGGWHLLGSFTPSTVVVLTPAAMALAVLVALAISSFEVELADWNFGWRQGVGLAGVACASVGLLPLLPSSASGSWQLPAHGVEASLTPISVAAQQVGLRVLWLGDPRILPVSGWSIEPGLAAATTTTDVTSPWGILPAAPAGPAATLGQAVTSALQGRTINLGATLGAQAVRYVVVDTSAAPSVTSILAPSSYPAPPNLLRALAQQRDLVLISASGGLTVYLVAEARPLVGRADPAQRSGWANALSPAPDQLGLPTPTRAGAIAIAAAPASSITAAVGGKALSPIATSPSTAVATATAGTLAVAVQPSPWPPLAATGEVALWVLVALALAGRLRRRSTAGVEPAPAPEVEAPALDAELP